MPLSSPVSPRDLGLKEKRFQSIQEIEAAVNIMVRRLNDVYKYNRRDHDRLAEDVADATLALAFKIISVAGQDDVVADSSADILTLVAGSNITLTTDPSADSVTIAAAGASANTVVCRAYRAAGNVTVTTGGSPKLFTIDTAFYDPSSMLDAANNKIVVPSDGYYLVIARLSWALQPASGVTEVAIAKNGAQYADRNYYADGVINQPIVSTIMDCSANDAITVTAYQTSGVSRLASGGTFGTWLAVAKM